MGRVEVPTTVTAPDNIVIKLVREDYLDFSNTFRVFFECAMGLFFALLGNIMTQLTDNKPVPSLNWMFLAILLVACVAFLWYTRINYRKAKKNIQPQQ